MKPPSQGDLQHEYNCSFLVCFDYNNNDTWIGRAFGHVFLYRNVSLNSSIKINPTLFGTLILPYKANVNTFASSVYEEYNAYIWTVKHEELMMKMNIMFGVASCVSIIKNILGIRAWWILTPKQLERYIKKEVNHARERKNKITFKDFLSGSQRRCREIGSRNKHLRDNI